MMQNITFVNNASKSYCAFIGTHSFFIMTINTLLYTVPVLKQNFALFVGNRLNAYF